MMCASERSAFYSEKSPVSKARSVVLLGRMPKGPNSQAIFPSTSPDRRTPTALVWAIGLGWGAFLGYKHEGTLQFAVVALSLAAITLWFERKQRIASYTLAFVVFAVWFLFVMGLAYWPARLLHHIPNKHTASHVSAAIQYHNEAAVLENKACGAGQPCTLSQEEWNAIYSADAKALAEARQADISDMNKHYPGFGDHFKNEFIAGLELIVDDDFPAKRPDVERGQLLVDRFGTWFVANEDAIRSGK